MNITNRSNKITNKEKKKNLYRNTGTNLTSKVTDNLYW